MLNFKAMRIGTKLAPFATVDLEELQRVRQNAPVQVYVGYERSVQHNRWFHKLVGVVADGIGMHPARLKVELKHKAGLWDEITISPVFGVHVEYKSTAFATMDEPDFTAFRKIAVEILFTDYLPGVQRRDVYEQVESLTGEPCPW